MCSVNDTLKPIIFWFVLINFCILTFSRLAVFQLKTLFNWAVEYHVNLGDRIVVFFKPKIAVVCCEKLRTCISSRICRISNCIELKLVSRAVHIYWCFVEIFGLDSNTMSFDKCWKALTQWCRAPSARLPIGVATHTRGPSLHLHNGIVSMTCNNWSVHEVSEKLLTFWVIHYIRLIVVLYCGRKKISTVGSSNWALVGN